MELLFLSLLLFLFTLFLVVLSLRILSPEFNGRKNLPPGKLGFPILGETLQFLSTGKKGRPEDFIKERANKYSSDVFKTSFYGEKIAVLCGPAGNKFLFSNENKLVTAWFPRSIEKIFPSSLQTSSKEEAVRNRKLLNGFLKPEALRKYVDVMDRIAIKHLETNWDFKKEVTVFPLANQYTLELACKLLLSIEDPKHIAKFSEPFEALSAGMFAVPINFPGTSFNGAIKGSEKIRKELEEIIRERKKDLMEKKLIMSAKQDILSHMLTTADENGQFMNEMNIADKIMGLLVGAHDSASAAITSIIKYLAELPHVYNEVLKEQIGVAASKPHGEPLNWEDLQKMKYSWNVASEVLRLAPPAQGNFREAIVDFTYAGFSIPKSWKLYWSVNSTHKNPEYFPEPEKFDPSRFEGSGPIPYTYVPFGGGPRICPGKEFVRLEILIFMHNVVRRFKWEKLIPDEKIIVKPLFMPEKGLPIRLYPH